MTLAVDRLEDQVNVGHKHAPLVVGMDNYFIFQVKLHFMVHQIMTQWWLQDGI